MNELEFQNILKEKGIEVSEHQLQQFQKYYEILVEWNEKMNLTAITDKEDDYIIVDKVSGNHKKADVYNIIKFVSENSKDIATIEATVSKIDNALKKYKVNIERNIEKLKKDNPSLPEDEVYLSVYKEKYNNTKEIRLKAYELLIEILKIKCCHYTFVDVNYAALVYDNLFLYMKERITDFNLVNGEWSCKGMKYMFIKKKNTAF